jgi:hypothetical protein
LTRLAAGGTPRSARAAAPVLASRRFVDGVPSRDLHPPPPDA